ncbi:DUF616 domain-containing protein [Acidimicrobiia bacterium]|jgi:hypothetical protein|nr:DUF616 domain-containing protein [Acidimicrobiia bacterium]
MKMSNIAVITSSIGKESNLLEQGYNNSADFYAFTDSSKLNENNSWEKIQCIPYISDGYFKNRINAKIFKILPFIFLPEYEYFIWIDSNLILKQDPKILVDEYLNQHDMALMKHSKRECVYDEAKEVIIQKLDYSKNIKNQYKYYKFEKYPKKNGLYDCSFRIQRNTDEIKKMSVMWWSHIIKFSSRDQISLPFVLNNLKVSPKEINFEKNIFEQKFKNNTNRKVKTQKQDYFTIKVRFLRRVSLLKKYIVNIKKP